MIDLYYWPTPNGWKVSIMLEECGLEYRTIPVDIGGGEQFKAEFLRISPNNRMPAIVDHEPLGGGEAARALRVGRDPRVPRRQDADSSCRAPAPRATRSCSGCTGRWRTSGPMMGNANHFKNYAKQLVDDPEQLAYGTRRFVGEVDRLCGVMDAQLSAHRYLAGADYTIADIITWPWASLVGRLIDEKVWTTFPNLKRWVDEVGARPAVQRGRAPPQGVGRARADRRGAAAAEGAALQPDERVGARRARGGREGGAVRRQSR